MITKTKRRADLTFKHNLKHGRHGWLRLTPAYSIKVVQQILESRPETNYVLDPFSGTGTTGLVCAEYGIKCNLIDINPFLVWLAGVKTANYTQHHLQQAERGASAICEQATNHRQNDDLWFPPISNISRWWSEKHLLLLSKLNYHLNQQFPDGSPAKDLLLIHYRTLFNGCGYYVIHSATLRTGFEAFFAEKSHLGLGF